MWDYLLPQWFPYRDTFKNTFESEEIKSRKRLHSCRLVIFMDDLDICPPKLTAEVVRSLLLLTKGSPFIIMISVDPRNMVSAIESESERFYSEAGVSGYEYLDKIVNLPFALPPMLHEEKAMICLESTR